MRGVKHTEYNQKHVVELKRVMMFGEIFSPVWLEFYSHRIMHLHSTLLVLCTPIECLMPNHNVNLAPGTKITS